MRLTMVLSVLLVITPYFGTIGYRIIRSLTLPPPTFFDYFDSYYWTVTWAVSGDFISGWHHGTYNAYSFDGFASLVLAVVAFGLGATIEKLSTLAKFLAGLALVFLLWENCLLFLVTIESYVQAVLIILLTSRKNVT